MRFIRFAAFLFLLAPLAMPQQTAAPRHPTSDPYKGDLSIFEYKDRDAKLQPGRVMDALGIQPGSTVADIGAGSGWFTVRASARVAPNGMVYAEDINPAAVKTISDRASKARMRDVRAVLGTPDDPKLPSDSLDAVLMLKVYHEIAHTDVFLRNLKPAMRAHAKFGIIDRNGNGADHGLNEPVVVQEVTAAGFHKVARYDFTKADGQDYFLVFEKN